MTLSNPPFVKAQFFDNNGDPADGYLLFTYDSGTSTKRDTFTDGDGNSANTNPIELDSAGRCDLYLDPVAYKFVLAPPNDTDPPTSPVWTVDPVTPGSSTGGSLDVTGTAGENLSVGQVCYLADGTGGTTAGRWYKADADATASSTAAPDIGFATADIDSGISGTFRMSGQVTGLAGLSVGDDYYISGTAGDITATAPTNARFVGRADSTTSLVLSIDPVDGSVTQSGVMNLQGQIFAGQKGGYMGTATSQPAYWGGVFFNDPTEYTVAANETDAEMTSMTIPANMLDDNGKGVRLSFGSSTAWGGANAKTYELEVDGTQCLLVSSSLTIRTVVEAWIVRVDSDSLDVCNILHMVGNGVYPETLTTRINSVDFTAPITVKTLGTTGNTSTISQTYFIAEALGGSS